MSRSELRTRSGRRVRLKRPLGSGGEGEVSLVEGGGEVAKVYWPAKRSSELERKLTVMVAHRPRDPMRSRAGVSLAWPTEVLLDLRGRFAGFLMPYLDPRRYRELHQVYLPLRYPSGMRWGLLVQTARNLASALDALHREGYVAGDLNASNVLASTNTVVTFVDCDSMQVPDPSRGRVYRCTVGKPEYTAPELRGVDFSTVDRTFASDRFALAVLICQLLVWGRHPFSGSPGPQITDNIAAGLTIFASRFATAPGVMPSADILPPAVMGLFERAFKDGHRSPDRRPSAGGWTRELDRLRAQLRTCSADAAHEYGDHLSTCPWCILERRLPGSAFPKSGRSWGSHPLRGRQTPRVKAASWSLTPTLPASGSFVRRGFSFLVRFALRSLGLRIRRLVRLTVVGAVLGLLLVVALVVALAAAGRGALPAPSPAPAAPPAAERWTPPVPPGARPPGPQGPGPAGPSLDELLQSAAAGRSSAQAWRRLAVPLRTLGERRMAAAASAVADLLGSEIPAALDWRSAPEVLELFGVAGIDDDEWLGDEGDRARAEGRSESGQVLYYLAHALDSDDREWLQKIEPRKGMRVERGIDWTADYGSQDGGRGQWGVITAVPPETRPGWVQVEWQQGAARNWYRWGDGGGYDLGLAIPWHGAEG